MQGQVTHKDLEITQQTGSFKIMLPIDLEWQLVIQKMVPRAESLQQSRETFIATTFPVLHKSIIQCSAACSVLPAP